MKLLFYINILSGGGAERVVANLSNLFQADGNDVVLVNTYKTLNEYYVFNNVKRVYLEKKCNENKSRFIKNIKRIKALRKIIKTEKPDVVLSFMLEPNFRTILATRGLKVKTIISVRNDPKIIYSGKMGRWISKRLMPKADGCVFQTEEAKTFFPKKLQNKSTIILNAVKEEFFSIVRKPIEGNIISIGRLMPQKNYKLLIDAFNLIKNENPNTTLSIYGDGKIKEELLDYISLLNLQERVRLFGHVENVEQILSTADMFVLPSNFEGMPNVLMEALASGTPCISTDCPCGGPRYLIENNVNGLLVPVNNVEILARSMLSLLKDNSRKNKFSIEGKKKAASFKPDVIYLQWLNYIKEIMEK